MKTEIWLRDAIGKTLAAVDVSGYSQAVLVFTDGTFATLGIDRGYDHGNEAIIEAPLDVLDFGDGRLVRVGIVTLEEIAAMRKERDDKLAADMLKRKQQEFERLKLELGK